MAKSTKANTSTATTKEVTKVETSREKNLEIEELKKKNNELSDKLDKLMEIIMNQNQQKQETSKDNAVEANIMNDISEKYNSNYIPKEINPNKQVMVMSLCYGILNLGNGGNNTIVQFSKYGETRPVLYSTLINIVNHNLRFAQTGKFYILDKDAVYHLGLSDYYKKLIPNEIINNITDYSPNAIESIISNIDDEQKEVIVKILSEKIYKGSTLDANKINLISELSGKDIMKKVEEMRTYTKK